MVEGPLFWYTLKTKVVDIGPKVLNHLKNPESQINCPRYIQLTESSSCPLFTSIFLFPANFCTALLDED